MMGKFKVGDLVELSGAVKEWKEQKAILIKELPLYTDKDGSFQRFEVFPITDGWKKRFSNGYWRRVTCDNIVKIK